VGQVREQALAGLAIRQWGVVTWEQMLAIGFESTGIKRRLADGRLQAVHREVYAVGHPHLSPQGRWLAAVMAYGEGALLSHRSAAALWGLARPRTLVIDVTAPAGRQGIRRREKIWIHRGRLHPEDRAVRAGIPVTTVARTLFDLAEFVSLKRLESAWEEADRLNLLQLRAVEGVCERGYGRRALRPTRRLLAEARASTITRSPLEDEFEAFCHAHHLPAPVFNTTVLGLEVDALWPSQHLIVELDGFAFHRHHAAFQRDRARDAAIQVAGYRAIRLTHHRLDNEAATVAEELRALLQANALLSQAQA
jgi:very-short-patch-repair endonuclease